MENIREEAFIKKKNNKKKKQGGCLVDGRFNSCMKYELYTMEQYCMFFLLSPQHLACYLITRDNHCCGRLSLWTLAAEERSYADDFTLFRISAFGEYYRIANKLVLFNCSGMYFISWPSMPMLIHSTPKELQVFFFL